MLGVCSGKENTYIDNPYPLFNHGVTVRRAMVLNKQRVTGSWWECAKYDGLTLNSGKHVLLCQFQNKKSDKYKTKNTNVGPSLY